MNKPNFFIIGAAKSGTSSLYHYVGQHPDVCMSIPKETWFFCFEDYEQGLEWYWERYFAKHYRGQKSIGETSVWYLHMPHVAPRLKESVPQAKLIAILRNPVDRAFSEWWMAFCEGVEQLPFDKAILDNIRRLESQENPLEATVEGAKLWLIYRGLRPGTVTDIDRRPRTYVENGYYDLQIEQYLEYFPKAQLKIFLFEDLIRDAEAVVKEIWRFIGVDPDYSVLNLEGHNVAAGDFGGRILHRIRRSPIRVSRLLPRVIKRRIVSFLKKTGEKPRMDPEVRKLLIDHYREHNKRLEMIIGRDLSHWMEL